MQQHGPFVPVLFDGSVIEITETTEINSLMIIFVVINNPALYVSVAPISAACCHLVRPLCVAMKRIETLKFSTGSRLKNVHFVRKYQYLHQKPYSFKSLRSQTSVPNQLLTVLASISKRSISSLSPEIETQNYFVNFHFYVIFSYNNRSPPGSHFCRTRDHALLLLQLE